VEKIKELNQLIWGMGLKFRAELVQRAAPFPDWVPIHQSFSLAATHNFLTLPEVVRQTLQRNTPEDIAQHGKRLGNVVSPLAIWSFGYHFLVGREILIDLGELKASDWTDEIALVLDFWRRLAFAHRGDGHLDNSEAGAANVFLPSATVQQLYDALVPVDTGIRRRIAQFLSTTEEYLSILNAEARIGVADSGPYPLNLERVLIVRDFFDLKGAPYPWRDTVSDLPYATCSLAFTLDPEDFHSIELSDQSELLTTPAAYIESIREIAFVSSDGGSSRVLPFTEMDWLTKMAKRSQSKLAEWFGRLPRHQWITAGALPWVLQPLAILPGEGARSVDDLHPRALQLLPVYEEDDIRAARWHTHRCLVPGNLSAFALTT
jgi:hypothetical protein